MEGSRHERAGITIAAYVIGVTTAFIFFSSTKDAIIPQLVVPTANVASVIEANTPTSEGGVVPLALTEETTPEAVLSYTEGRLEMTLPDGVHLLSFNPEISGLNADVEVMGQGYHYGELSYTVTADNTFVFFCESKAEAASTCLGYVYDVNADRIHQVTKNGAALEVATSDAPNAIFTALGLKIGSNYSVNQGMPWVMMDESSPIDLQ